MGSNGPTNETDWRFVKYGGDLLPLPQRKYRPNRRGKLMTEKQIHFESKKRKAETASDSATDDVITRKRTVMNEDNMEMKRQTTALKEHNMEMKGQTTTMKEDNMEMKGQTTAMKEDDMQMKGQTTAMKEDDMQMKGQTTAMKKHNMEMKGQTTAMKKHNMEKKGQTTAMKKHDMEMKGQTTAMKKPNMEMKGQTTAMKKHNMEMKGQTTALKRHNMEMKGQTTAMKEHNTGMKDPTTGMKEESGTRLLAGAARAASYNMVLQLMLRGMTFVLNAIILRYISRDMLGVVNVRMTLLYTTATFLATEAFDKACLSKLEGQSWRKIINLMWFTVPMCIVCSVVLSLLWMFVLDSPDPGTMPHYRATVACYAVSTVLVVLSRPLFVIGQKCLFVKLKVMSAGISELCKCIITIALIVFYPSLGLLSFAIAQVVFGVMSSLTYYGYFVYYLHNMEKKDDDFPIKSVKDLLPKRTPDSSASAPVYVDRAQASLTWSIFKQSFLKQILTEGEKYVMTVFNVLSFADQGVYDVVNNLGSMAARFLFQPIEESGYLFFSQLLTRGEPCHRQKQESIELATEVLRCLLKMVILIGCVILAFGYSYSYLALDLYGGALLSSGSGPLLLRWFCLYVLVIAVNGTTECFVFATMSKAEVDSSRSQTHNGPMLDVPYIYNHKMLIFSAVFLISSLGLTQQFGSVGFILANCLNMGARITHSIYYIKQYFKDSKYAPLEGNLPSLPVIVALVASLCVTVISESQLCCAAGLVYRLAHVGVGGACLLTVLVCVYLTETATLTFIKQQYKQQHQKSS